MADGVVDDATLHRAKPRYPMYKVAAQPRGSLITRRILRLALQHPLPPAITKSTSDRRTRVKKLLASVRQLHAEVTPQLFASCLAVMFAPATAHGYFVTAMALVPEWKGSLLEEARSVALALQQDIARTRRPRAIPRVSELASRLSTITDVGMRAALILQFVSASRHADLTQANMTHIWQLRNAKAIRFQFPVWKSDRRGSHWAAKVIWIPEHSVAEVVQAFRHFPTFSDAHSALAGVCTPHDLRRLAMSYLADVGVKESEVLILTQHAAATASTAHFRRYVKPTAHQAQAKVQLKLSWLLWNALHPDPRRTSTSR